MKVLFYVAVVLSLLAGAGFAFQVFTGGTLSPAAAFWPFIAVMWMFIAKNCGLRL